MIKVLNKIKLSKKRKGFATIEAAMIFPLIMFIMFGIIYLTIVHYQNNVMIAESIRAMNRAGAYWQYIDMDKTGKIIEYNENNIPSPFDSSIPKDGIINVEMIKKRNPYRTIIDLVSDVISEIIKEPFGKKRLNAKKYIASRMANVQFKQYTTDVDTKINGLEDKCGFLFFGDDLKVEVEKSYINPLLGLSRSFFGENNIMQKLQNKNITVSSVISNQSEFIRNFDTIYDLSSDFYHFLTNKE